MPLRVWVVQVLNEIGVEVTEAEVLLLSSMLDVDNKGKLDYYRFCRFVELDPQEMCVPPRADATRPARLCLTPSR